MIDFCREIGFPLLPWQELLAIETLKYKPDGRWAHPIVGVMIAMMFWVRSEGNELRAEQKEDRKDILSLIRSIDAEMKDFHYRLLEIERARR